MQEKHGYDTERIPQEEWKQKISGALFDMFEVFDFIILPEIYISADAIEQRHSELGKIASDKYLYGACERVFTDEIDIPRSQMNVCRIGVNKNDGYNRNKFQHGQTERHII